MFRCVQLYEDFKRIIASKILFIEASNNKTKPPMSTPNRAVRAAAPKIQRNGGPVCGGAPFNVTNPSNDVQNVNIGVNGFNPKIISKNTLPQRAPTDTAVAMKHLPGVVPVAYFAPRIVAGMTPKKKSTTSIFAGQRGTSRSGSNSSSLGANEPRDHEIDDILGRHERISLLLPSEAASEGVPATPIVGTSSIETMTTFGRKIGQSLPPFVEKIERTELMHDASESKRLKRFQHLEDVAAGGPGHIGDDVLPVPLPIRHERGPMSIHSSSDIDARTPVVERLIVWLFAVAAAVVVAVAWAPLRWMTYVNAASGVLLFDERRKSIATKKKGMGHFLAVCHRRRYWANPSALMLFVFALCCGIDGSWAVFTPVDTAALKAAVGSCSGDPVVCTGGCLGETPDGSCPTFAASNDATENPYGVMGDWGVSKVTSLQESTSTHVPFSSLFFFQLDLFTHPSLFYIFLFTLFWMGQQHGIEILQQYSIVLLHSMQIFPSGRRRP